MRYCPALKKKPQSEKPDLTETKRPRFDPFADPAPELLIAQVPHSKPSHTLVLNKYPVIQNHFILATKANKPQTSLLEEDDIGLTHACLRAWKDRQHEHQSSRLFAFFNSGENSGASQEHRHLQFLPVEDMLDADNQEWGILIDRMNVPAHPNLPLYQDPSLPIVHFSTPLAEGISTSDLHLKYMLLMRAAFSATQNPHGQFDEEITIENGGKTVLSYNLAMTAERLAICPRRQEAAVIPGAGPESSVAINGTILAGTLMVKDEEEWDVLRKDHSLIDGILTSIGYPLAAWAQRVTETKI